MFSKILMPVNPDDIDFAVGILPHASWLAKKLDIPVVLLSIIPVDRENEDAEEPGVAKIYLEAEKRVKGRLEQLISVLAGEGVQVEPVVVFGSPSNMIVSLCGSLACDLIAMSTHGGGLLSRAIVGSITTEVIRKSTVPVLVINPTRSRAIPTQQVDISTVFVPLDGSREAEAVLPYVEYLASRLSLNVVLIHAVKKKSVTASLVAILGKRSRDYLDKLTAGLVSRGISAHWELLEGEAGEQIVETVEDVLHHMIAVTHTGRTGLKRWLRGSVSEEIIRETGDPVLVVPPALSDRS